MKQLFAKSSIFIFFFFLMFKLKHTHIPVQILKSFTVTIQLLILLPALLIPLLLYQQTQAMETSRDLLPAGVLQMDNKP